MKEGGDEDDDAPQVKYLGFYLKMTGSKIIDDSEQSKTLYNFFSEDKKPIHY